MFIRFIVLIAFVLGTILSFWGQVYLNFSPVLSSALVGLIGCFFKFKNLSHPNLLPLTIYCGSFAGMCSTSFFITANELYLMSMLGGIIYALLLPLFNGLGGKLGTVAFISVALFYLLREGLI